MKTNVFFINGGNSKSNYKDYYDYIKQIDFDPFFVKEKNYNHVLVDTLGHDYNFIRIDLPNKEFADYKAWEIMFEKSFIYMNDNDIICATSLGWTFILKYLQNHTLNVKISKLILIATCINDTANEVLGNFELTNKDFSNITKQIKTIYLYHSKDDDCVPFTQYEELKILLPNAICREFIDKWHFYKESRLLELEEDIKS